MSAPPMLPAISFKEGNFCTTAEECNLIVHLKAQGKAVNSKSFNYRLDNKTKKIVPTKSQVFLFELWNTKMNHKTIEFVLKGDTKTYCTHTIYIDLND